MNDRTANIVIWVVTTIWAANVLVGMLGLFGYSPDGGINAIFTLVVGGAFAARSVGKSKGGDGEP